MTIQQGTAGLQAVAAGDLVRYYLVRGIVAVAWVAAAVAVGTSNPAAAAVLLVSYPAWDALANWFDANGSGGLLANPSQALNVVVSLFAALAVAVALRSGMNAVLAVFGVWAALAGLAQLVTGIRRWRKFGAQWAMILSGAQSILAGAVFVHSAGGAAVPAITDIAPYAGFGAFYFLVSALWLIFANRRRTA
ncbi:DUF308 domain-containing protein [Tardiphaga sp. 813_E8_N1_3]|uniref:DUF308 domain-containing protein n=1 Tax=Tardiphaga sp. 813_E8_N1_3 TaxID=3240760 RepID=UPI003F2825B3